MNSKKPNDFSKIVLASNNKGKLREFNDMFADTDIHIIPQGEFDVEDAIEDGLSFVENAIIKARHACKETSLPAIADDSGLEVDFLKGAPGIYSARYSGEHGNDRAHNQLVLEQLTGLEQEKRTARFQCVLAFMRHADDPTPLICQASWEGFILEEERGVNGFGYDPLFWVPEHECSSAELSKETKNSLSHRGKALQLLLAALKEKYTL
ncbi:MAG: RdgB/HAM1 family non-canonical purine NTP pyrophosphatase [Cellvibrionaceae bacterium]